MPFHALIRRVRGHGDGRLFIFNQSGDWITERIVEPWDRGDDMVLNGEHWNPREVQVAIYESDQDVNHAGRSLAAWNAMTRTGASRTDDFLTRPAGDAASGDIVEFATDRRKVMAVHGRNSTARDSLFTFLRAIDLRPMEWTQLVGAASSGAPYIGEILDAAFSECQAVVVLSTPDDVAYLRGDLVPEEDPEGEAVPAGQARPNVFYEAGMAMGRFPTRTIFVELGTMRPASDLAGLHAVRLNKGPECRRDLAKRLEDAGCEVNTDGTDWLSAGDFTAPAAVDAALASVETRDGESDALLRRIEAFIGDLDGGKGYPPMTLGATFNELAEESGIEGIARAEPMTRMPSKSKMTMQEMRVLLNQIKAQL